MISDTTKNENSKIGVVLGIDVGGTNTVFGLVDKSGRIYSKWNIETNAHEPAEWLFKRLFDKFNIVFEQYKNDVELIGVGIGAPNANYFKGTVENPPNLKWGTVNLIDLVHRFHNLPVAVTNDANAASLGEMLFGAARGMKNFVEITLGTGLGSGIVVNGQLVYGHDGFAGEIGHVIVVPGGRECGCGRNGCLETYCSATGIKRTVYELLCELNDASTLRDVPFHQLSAKKIYEEAERGDHIALAAFDVTAQMLGEAMANTVAHLSPEAIVLFGGLANAGDLLLKPVKKYMESNMLSTFQNKVSVIPSGLPEGDAAVLGAAALMWSEKK